MALSPGTRLGAYQILSHIGSGGMGEVYRAHDTRLKRAVALKVLPDAFAQDSHGLARLRREAELLARLNHTNIAAVYGLEEAEGITAIVLELVEGQTLGHLIVRGQLAIGDVLPIARQIANALVAAHEKNIVHRDIKPANIKVTLDGQVKVLDFGVAKALDPASSPVAVALDDSVTTIASPAAMTAVGVRLGTAGYMSPEQVRGKPVDKRSDIWAFGCVLYEMLTKQAVFLGETVSDTLALILTQEPAWTALPTETPASIQRLLRRCLLKDRKERLADMGDARFEIDEALAAASVAVMNPRAGGPPATDSRRTYVNAPPLPVNYVVRPEALETLRDIVIAGGGDHYVALTALEGMGGIGKTVLAQALCHDRLVQQAFPDGVIWITIGKEPLYEVVTQMREVGKAFHDDVARYDNMLGCINQYRSIFRDKAVLIVLDDVWHVSDVEPFCADSPRSRLLFTTRDASIAAAVGAREHSVDLLTGAQSREVLARWSRLREDTLPSQTDDLIAECGRLPLALSMIGAMLRAKPLAFWQRVLDLLRKADLEKVRMEFPNYAHPTLFRAIQVSVDELSSVIRERYFGLAVLLEDMSADLTILRSLWNTDEFETLETSEQLVSMCLAQRVGDAVIRLHDLQLDYVRTHSPDREVLPLLHDALRLGAHVFVEDPTQFVSQVTGRLQMHQNQSGIGRFSRSLAEASPRPWLRCLHPTLRQAGGSVTRYLKGNIDHVFDVALSADGRRAVSCGGDGTLSVWDVDTGSEIRTLRGHSEYDVCVDITPDGRWAVSGSFDRTLKVWNLDTGRAQYTLPTRCPGGVTDVAVSADGRRVVFVCGGREKGSVLEEIQCPDERPLQVWEIDSSETRALESHPGPFSGVALSADGGRAIAASADGSLIIWDVGTGRKVRTLEGHSWHFRVALSADGRRAIAVSSDGSLKIWDTNSGREVQALESDRDPGGTAPDVSAGGQWAATSEWSKSGTMLLTVWDLNTGRARRIPAAGDILNHVAISADGRRVVSSGYTSSVTVWNVDAGRELPSMDRPFDLMTRVAVSATGRRAVSLSDVGTLKAWDVRTGVEECTLAPNSPLNFGSGGLGLSADGRRAVSGSENKVRIWDIDTRREYTLRGHSKWVTSVALSADGHRAVSGCEDGTLKVWELEVGREPLTLDGHSDAVTSVAMSDDGLRAVSASYDGTVKIWHTDTGSVLHTLAAFRDHSQPAEGTFGSHDARCEVVVAMSGDGRRVVSAAADDNIVKLWDAETGLELLALSTNQVHDVALSTDGSRAVSASHDGTLKVWDVETGKALATFTCDSPAFCCALGTSGLILAGNLSVVHFLSLELTTGSE